MALLLVSVNVDGLRDQTKRAGFMHWLHSLPFVPDVVCLQEAHCTSPSECEYWFRSSGFSVVASSGSSRSCGCIVLFRPMLSLVKSSSDNCGRFLLCEFSLRGVTFRVACVYAPNRNPDRDTFLDDVSSRLDPSIPTVLVGDFNTVFDRATDRIGSVIGDTSRESSVALERLFNDACCIDIWRYLHPSSSAFTWTKSDGSISSRIDLIGCPYVWVASVSACNILPCPFSDHCAVSVTLTVPDVIPPGPGLWKLNTSVLEEEEYCRLINDFWTDWKHCKLSFPSLSKWWDAVKGKIKGIMVSYCVRRSLFTACPQIPLLKMCFLVMCPPSFRLLKLIFVRAF